MNQDYYKNKSSYWKKFPDQYTIDEKGNVTIHDDADEEVKKSYKQYTIEQMMAGFFVEEEEEEEEVERTFSIDSKALDSLNKVNEFKKIDFPEMHLKKDNSMYDWMSHKEYYKVVDGKYIFNEDTPVEILESYKNYHKQMSRLKRMKQANGNALFDFLFDSTGLKTLLNKNKKKK